MSIAGAKPIGELAGEIQSGGEWTAITDWTVDSDGCFRSARIPWADSEAAAVAGSVDVRAGDR